MAEKRGEGLQNIEVQPGEVGEQQIHPKVVEKPEALPSTGEVTPSLPDVVPLPEQIQSSPDVPGVEHTEKVAFKTMPPPPEFPDKLEDSISWGDY